MSRALVMCLLAGVAPSVTAQTVTFTPLAPAPAPYNGVTVVSAIAGDGSRIAGDAESSSGGFIRAVAWNADGSFAGGAPVVIPGELSFGAALTQNGGALFGTRWLPFGPTYIERPFRYDLASGAFTVFGTSLGGNGASVELEDVSGSGAFALVTRFDPTSGVEDAIRVDVATGETVAMGAVDRRAFAINAAGNVAVGELDDPNLRGWRFTVDSPSVDQDTCQFSNNLLCQTSLGSILPRSADARAVSPEGNWIGGRALIGDGYGSGFDVPYATNGTDLFVASLEGCGYGGGQTRDISSESAVGGPVVVGSFGCNNQPQAFFWTASEGLVNLQDYLSGAGVDLSNWFLTEATAVSDDGLTIAGNGFFGGQFRSWVATRVPAGAACDDIDFNNNGVFPEDQDVIDFFEVLAGGVPATCDPVEGCNDIDFNNNDVFPEDQDVVDFFEVLAGGQCP